jgi:hypothetical protein
MNLEAMFHLAHLGDRAGVDLWYRTTDDGRGIRMALDFLLPAALGEQPWNHPELNEVRADRLLPLLLQAARRYDDSRYGEAVRRLSRPDGARPETGDYSALLYPIR